MFGYAPLHYAALHGFENVVSLLLKGGADPTLLSHDYRQSPLHCSAIQGSPRIAKALLDAGARRDQVRVCVRVCVCACVRVCVCGCVCVRGAHRARKAFSRTHNP